MKRFITSLAVLALSVPVLADTASVDYTEFAGTGIGFAQTTVHNPDLDPWKGFFQLVTVKNISDEAWGDFHFELIREIDGFDPSLVVFSAEQASWTSQSPSSYVISGDQLKLDFYFYGDAVEPEETVSFGVYTDNTAGDHNPFGVMYWPTPVPEPAAISMLVLGCGALVARRRRRR